MSASRVMPLRPGLEDAVDAVVTWVDGADPAHVETRRMVLERTGGAPPSTIPAGVDKTRFEDNNEIEYCLRSIRKFAPWIRTIFLVTDQQKPRFLCEAEQARLGVVVIDHKQIFAGYEEMLPTFNSLSIETALHRVPGLASRYIYFNDDFILLAPTSVEDFFTADGVVLRGAWQSLEEYGRARLAMSKILNHALKKFLGINRAMSVLQQIRGAQLAGARGRFFKVAHTPYPVRKETVKVFFKENEPEFRNNIAYRFRSLNQYAVTSLVNHIEILNGNAKMRGADDSMMICFNRDSRSQLRKKLKKLCSGKIKFLCIQSLEESGRKDKDQLISLVQRVTLN